MRHKLKCWPEYFQAMLDDKKQFDIRVNDRGFAVGDILVQEEYDPVTGSYSGRTIVQEVTWILYGGKFDIPDHLVVMSVVKIYVYG